MSPRKARDPAAARATIARVLAQLDAAGHGAAARQALVTWSPLEKEILPDGALVHRFPYPNYALRFDALWRAVEALGFLEPGDYFAWLNLIERDRLVPAEIAGFGRDDIHMTLVLFLARRALLRRLVGGPDRGRQSSRGPLPAS